MESDDEVFGAAPVAEDNFGDINFDEEAGSESDDEVGSRVDRAFRERTAWQVAPADQRNATNAPSLDAAQTDARTETERAGAPYFRPDARRLQLAGQRSMKLERVSPDEYLPETEIPDLDEAPFKRQARRKKTHAVTMPPEELINRVSSLLSRMEMAAMNDIDSNANRRPAIEKLKMLEEVDEACINRQMQPLLLSEGLLGVLKSWIEPLRDGTLPNIKIRTTVLKILHKLPINTADQVDKQNLKMSKIGSRVMFLSRISDETRENRRLAAGLVEKWTRPIFEQARRYEEEEERAQSALKARRRRIEAEKREEEKRKSQKTSDPALRYSVMRPQPSRDYVINPQSKVDASAVSGSKKSGVMQQLNRLNRSHKRRRQ